MFVNRQDMGFDDCEHTEARRRGGESARARACSRVPAADGFRSSTQATQHLELSPSDLSCDTRTELKFVKFQARGDAP